MSGIDGWTRWSNRLLWLMSILVVWMMDAANSGDILLVPCFILPCMLTNVSNGANSGKSQITACAQLHIVEHRGGSGGGGGGSGGSEGGFVGGDGCFCGASGCVNNNSACS